MSCRINSLSILEATPRLKLVFLPPYIPQLNLIEGFMIGKFKNKILIAAIFSLFFLISFNVQAANFTDNQTVDSNKAWTVSFNSEVSFDDLTKQGITVTDSEGTKVNVGLQLGQDSKTVTVTAPQGGYTAGESYTLNIGNQVHSTKGKILNNECKLSFNIKSNGDKMLNGKKLNQAIYLQTITLNKY
ncbi:Ig-like domain-containing protein [Clostridium sp. Mt-5]|uniref:Ig-like domain-containing protein n=1 Tax=Clostridium moutaii TaxID=3240932 RepID=A0ABV4BVR6_9CLOT